MSICMPVVSVRLRNSLHRATGFTLCVVLFFAGGCSRQHAEEKPRGPHLDTIYQEEVPFDQLEQLDEPAEEFNLPSMEELLKEIRREIDQSDSSNGLDEPNLDPFGENSTQIDITPSACPFAPTPPGLQITEPIPLEEVRPFMPEAKSDSPDFRIFPPTLEEYEAMLPPIEESLELDEQLVVFEPKPIKIKPTTPIHGPSESRLAVAFSQPNDESRGKAVAAALQWLVEHQLSDGGWNFDHTGAPRCDGQCRNPGTAMKARNAATGLALLSFLGAGHTHMDGKYKETVKSSIEFLVRAMKLDSAKGGSWHEEEGSMYSHGIATLAICEAYAMTHDKMLHKPAQEAIYFICYSQAADGGWRYLPKQSGDTSVFGWQIAALKSGHLAYLRVPPQVVKGAERFLDKVQASGGSEYGYTVPTVDRHTTTAIGLLCRMYLGWKRDNESLQRGVDLISDWGPSTDVYYNYYATQVMYYWGGDRWKKWNEALGDRLIQSQEKEGHEAGSWYSTNAGGTSNAKGGRLYHTALSTMTLEVKYRHMPVIGCGADDQDFEE